MKLVWAWDPAILSLLAFPAGLYALGLGLLWRRAGAGRGIRRWEAACFAVGWLCLFAALISPLHTLGGILFSAHMVQHEVLILIAAPLLVLGRPLLSFLWALPREDRERAGRWTQSPGFSRFWRLVTAPVAVWVLHGLALWVWHLPGLYQAALRNEFLHALQHLSFFGTAALFWWALIHGRFGRLGYGVAVLWVFTTSMHSGILGALLTFAPRLWYPVYDERTAEWGLSALEDQQLAGLIMWIPAGVVFILLALGLFAAWMGEAERRVAHTRSETLFRSLQGGTTKHGA